MIGSQNPIFSQDDAQSWTTEIGNLTIYGAAIALIGVIITIGLNVIFIPKYGFMASAWANFACYLSMMLISFIWGRKVFKVNYNFKKLIAYSVLAIALFFLSVLFDDIEFVCRMLINTGLILFYLIVVVFFERRQFLSGILSEN